MSSQIHIIVKGRVQGVYFREFTKRQALSLGLRGTVKNLGDGSVEIFARGDDRSLESLKKWCWEGSPYSTVDNVIVTDISIEEDWSSFRVIF